MPHPNIIAAHIQTPLKAAGRHYYVHLDSFELLPPGAATTLVAAESLAKGHLDLCRFRGRRKRLKDKSCFSSWSRARDTCLAAGFGR